MDPLFVAGLVTSSVLDPDGDTIPGTADNCPDVANRTQTDVDRDRIGDACDRSDASGGPALAKTVIATVVTGDVYVRYPAGFKPRQAPPAGGAPAGFVPLKGAEVLPVGSSVDTLKGRVAVDSVGGSAATSGGARKTQTSDFYRGVFQIKQARAKKPVTDILLRSPGFAKDCSAGAATKGARAAGARSKKVVSRLWGNGKGNFRTRARNSTATVRGTIWLTEERCEGSFTRVQRGIVTVRDLRRNRTFTVRAGRGYLARATRVSAKKSTTRRP